MLLVVERRSWVKIGRKSYIHACVFRVFKAVKIQDGHCLNVPMKLAQNSDYKTHAKKLNPTSRTEIGYKSLWCIFFGAPCIYIYVCRHVLWYTPSGYTLRWKELILTWTHSQASVDHLKSDQIWYSLKVCIRASPTYQPLKVSKRETWKCEVVKD